jgi:hypothetical protein
MEFIVISLFIFIIIAWFALINDLRKGDHKREAIQKMLDDSL